ncbi:V-type ATP synthase subunit F [Oscillospiraceae bacterium MB08-C2-2]|nr:V-type ATP synthase subunit F [Oscillospiraceae bacterium MB08-C2-2]
MYKIAVLGDRDSIYGFAALGLEIFPVSGKEEAAEAFKALTQGTYAVVYITEATHLLLSEEIEKHSGALLPAVIPIPGVSGNTGAGIRRVKKMVEQAVGSDIIFGSEG